MRIWASPFIAPPYDILTLADKQQLLRQSDHNIVSVDLPHVPPAEVGPDRMKARGLDEAGLEAYYQSRNLLKAQVTSMHVANAVLFFATRQTPTTGATIPVDGGLPDSTPR